MESVRRSDVVYECGIRRQC